VRLDGGETEGGEREFGKLDSHKSS
jgi:hypothetical protein